MFWGLTLEAGKRYAQQVENSFHISMAALDVRASSDETLSVVVEVEKNEFILCNLNKKSQMQQAIDLNFMREDTIAFTVKGKGVVHLTGFLVPDEFDEDEFDDMEEEEDDDEEVPQLQAIQGKKGVEEKKRKAESPVKVQPAAKKSKVPEPVMNGNDESDDDEMEEEEEDEDVEEEEGDEILSQVEEGEDDSDDEDAEEEGEEEEDEDDDDEEVEEEEEEEVAPPVSAKKQQNQQKTPQKQQKTPQKPEQKQKTPQKQEQKQKTPQKQEQSQKTPNKQQNGGATPKEQSAKKGEKQSPKVKEDAKNPSTPGTKKTLHGGVIVEDLVVGSGPPAAAGRTAAVYYVGRTKHNNKQFDASQSGPPFKFKLGKGDVIKGWDIGVQGMKVGGKRRVICPPHMAYGNKGSPPVIPPNSTLVFDIELKGVA